MDRYERARGVVLVPQLAHVDIGSVSTLVSSALQYPVPLLLLVLCWANINSGFWNLANVSSPLQMIHAGRAVVPYLLPLIGLHVWSQARRLQHPLNPVRWLAVYGAVALLASALSPRFVAAFYFGMAYMMNVLVPASFFGEERRAPLRAEQILLYMTWGILTFYVLAIYILMHDQLGVGYAIYNSVSEVEGMAMSRSSGLARFFGVAGLIYFSRLWQGRSHSRWLFVLPFCFCGWVVWAMQSRGGMFGFFAGLVLLFFLSRASWRAYVLAGVAAIALVGSGRMETLSAKVKAQVARGQDEEDFASMSGRTRAYKAGLKEIAKNPLIGQGNWADRLTIGEHVHNSYLQALMNAGIVGFIPYMASWIIGWYLFYRLYRVRARLSAMDQQLFLEAAAVMMFFTVRSIPETTTASFSVDSMIMVPVYLYLFALYQRVRGEWPMPGRMPVRFAAASGYARPVA